MARRFRARGPAFRGRANRPLLRWTADTGNFNPAAGALVANDILLPADYETSSTLEARCTVIRTIITGSIGIQAAGAVTFGLGLFTQEDSESAVFGAQFDPLLPAQMIVNPPMVWMVGGLQFATAAGVAPRHDFFLDVKTKRKMSGDSKLQFVVSNAAGGVALTGVFSFRMLLRLNA